MGNCACDCQESQFSLELDINEAWLSTDLTKISPTTYFNLLKKYLDQKEFLENEELQDQFFSTVLNSITHRSFIERIKKDLIIMARNGNLHLVIVSLVFFTNYKDYFQLTILIHKMFLLIKYCFKIEADIKIDKDLFKEVLDIYILLGSQLSLKYISNYEIDNEAKKDHEFLSKFYLKRNRNLLSYKLFEYDQIFFLSHFLQENFNKINHFAIRNELKVLYISNLRK